MTRTILALAALAALFCISAGTKDADKKADKEKLQGTWKFVSVQVQGREEPMPDGIRVVITSDTLTMVYPKDGDNKEEKKGWKYTIDPSKDPKEMDWFVEETPGQSIHQPAIYVLEGATLKICSTAQGKPRPTKFESKRGDFGGLWVLKRVAPPATQQAAK
ncbi:MAG TPA: TIGR03067 domain-containing protein [Planctomycetaceae bacterium]|jgi:uncharacterized protein (TIGR03067 family)|nr:TIGR03067 domain-containing protein [Planctomycetaceae bacterium]